MDQANLHELQSALMANLGDMVFLTGKTGEILFANDSTNILGHTQKELIGSNFHELIDSIDQQSVSNIYEAISGMAGATYVAEYRMRRKNGEVIWMEGKLVNMLHNRAIAGIITTARDITEHKLAYEYVRQSEKQFRHAFEQVAIGMANMSPEGIWLHMNNHLCVMTGFNYNELYYMKYTDLFIPSERAAVLSNMKGMLDSQSNKSSGQRHILRKDGSQLWVEELLTRIYDEETGLQYFTLVLKDIDAVKKTETELAYRNKELDTFIYRASHDLRGPITTIMGLTDIALLDTKDEQAREYFNNCRDVAGRMEKAIYNLLAVTQVRQIKTTIMTVLPREIIYRNMHDKKHSHRLPGIDIHISVDEAIDYNTDAALIGIIITQLMDNALIFSRDNERHRVDIKIGGDGRIIKISVKDNGSGIPEKEQQLIFDLYHRSNNNHTGSGVGLYLVKAAVEKLGGTIRVSSTINEGTEMMVYLPNCIL